MGNSTSADLISRNKYNPSDWTHVEALDYCNVVKNKSNILAEEYQLHSNTKLNSHQELEIYDFRRTQNQPVVRIYGANFVDTSSTGCCGNQNMRKVLTQRIPNRLTTIGQITFPEALYALSQCLRGYRQITKKLGASNITANMIGLDQTGRIKVWINDIWAQNHPPVIVSKNKAIQDIQGSINEAKMIQNLFNIIETQTEGGRFPQSFKDQIISQQWNFIKSENLVRTYAQQNNIIISQYIIVNKSTLIEQVISSVLTVQPTQPVQPIQTIQTIQKPVQAIQTIQTIQKPVQVIQTIQKPVQAIQTIQTIQQPVQITQTVKKIEQPIQSSITTTTIKQNTGQTYVKFNYISAGNFIQGTNPIVSTNQSKN